MLVHFTFQIGDPFFQRMRHAIHSLVVGESMPRSAAKSIIYNKC
jgi:hypothetical protein